MVVYKYTLSPGYAYIKLPLGAKVLHADFQESVLQVWVLQEVSGEGENRMFLTVGTGQFIEESYQALEFISTAYVAGLVFHVFEVR